jgi:hypothetical protein
MNPIHHRCYGCRPVIATPGWDAVYQDNDVGVGNIRHLSVS